MMLKHHNIVFVVGYIRKIVAMGVVVGVGARTSYIAMKPCYKFVMALTLDDYGKYTTCALCALEVYFLLSSRDHSITITYCNSGIETSEYSKFGYRDMVLGWTEAFGTGFTDIIK